MKKCVALILILVSLTAAARKQAVGPTKLHKTAATETIYDTITTLNDSLRCSGYDKPNRATRETFFITNLSGDTINGVNITLEYFDMRGRQLHSATHTIMQTLPPGETRNVSVSSWDRNNAFHYELSPAPQRRASTPYRVRSSVNFVVRLSKF